MMLRRLLIAARFAAVFCGLAASAGHAADTAQPEMLQLSDERLLSRWANPVAASAIYRDHSYESGKIGDLRFFTEDGFPEVYLLLRRYKDESGRVWVELRIPKRPNGRVGWVPREKLGQYNRNVFQLTIDRKKFRGTLRENGRTVWSAPVGVGAVGTKTPAGNFYIREKFRFRNLELYGTRAIGTSAYAPTLSDWPNGGVVGIHGTSQPELIPGRPSHGCVRVRNPDVERLWRLVRIGTPLRII